MRSFKYYLFIIAVSLLPMAPQFFTSRIPHTSDGIPHIARMAAMYEEVTHGQFPVRWIGSFNYGYGSSELNFYYPLPYIISLPLTAVGVGLADNLKIGFTLSFLIAGIGMLAFARKFFKDEIVALLVTVMYQFAPFRLVETLVRGSLGELYALAFFPVTLYGLLLLWEKKTTGRFLFSAFGFLALATSHNVVGFSFIAVTLLFALVFAKSKIQLLWTAGALALGFLWGAFYLVPAFLQHKFVLGSVYTKDLYLLHFVPFIKFFIPNLTNDPALRIAEVPVQIGLFHVLGLIAAGWLVWKGGKQGKPTRPILVFALAVTAATLAFMQPIAMPLWKHISIIRQFQFPWRFLTVICFTSAIASAAFLRWPVLRKPVWFGFFISGIVLSTVVYWVPYQGFDGIVDSYYRTYPRNTTYFSEMNSIWTAGLPTDFPKTYVEAIAGTASASAVTRATTKHTFRVHAQTDATILDRTFFFPGWRAYVDGSLVPIEFQDQNYRGLITFRVPSGNHDVRVEYQETGVQRVGNSLTILSAAGVVAWFVIRRVVTLRRRA